MNELFEELDTTTNSYMQLCNRIRKQLLLEKSELEENKAQFQKITAKIHDYHSKEPITLNIGLAALIVVSFI